MELHNNRLLISILVLLVVGYGYWETPRSLGPRDLNAMIGTWTEEKGEPGNFIRFGFVPIELPTTPAITAQEGIAAFKGHFGKEEIESKWNYENFEPLRLNVVFQKKSMVAAIKPLDADHILIRFCDDPTIWQSPVVFDGPDVKVLKRLRD